MRTLYLAIAITASSVCLNLHAQTFNWALTTTTTSGYGPQGVAMDRSLNNSIVVGSLNHGTTDFDPGSGTQNLGAPGSIRLFVAAYDNIGAYQWAFEIAGTATSSYNLGVDDVVCDAAGNIYVVGSVMDQTNVDLDPGAGTALISSFGQYGYDMFVVSYDPMGNYRWHFLLGNSGSSTRSRTYNINVTAAGELILVGEFCGPPGTPLDFDPGAGTATLLTNYGNVGFMAWYDTNGNYVRAQMLGIAGETFISRVEPTEDGDIIVGGRIVTNNATIDFDPGAGTSTLSSGNSAFQFLAKYDQNGNFIHAHGFSYPTGGHGVLESDSSGNYYFAFPYYAGTLGDIDPGAGTTTYSNNSSEMASVLVKYDAAGNYVWSFQVSGTSAMTMVMDQSGSLTLSGGITIPQSGPGDFDPGSPTVNPTGTGIFVSRYTTNGDYISFFGIYNPMGHRPQGRSLYITPLSEIYLMGNHLELMDYNPSPATFNLPLSGYEEMFIAKYLHAPASITDDVTPAQLTVYPNPVADYFSVTTMRQGTIEIFSVDGKLVLTQPVQSGLTTINVQTLPAGVYTTRFIDSEGGIAVTRIVKSE